jgi:hypothetical protein
MEPTAQQVQSVQGQLSPEQPTVVKTKVCPLCKYVVQPSWYFCPNCSKKLKMKPLSTSIWRQIGVYLVSIIFPPFGIFPAINYFRQPSWKARTVGILCILFTILSVWVTIWYTNVLFKQINTEMNTQLEPLQKLGY